MFAICAVEYNDTKDGVECFGKITYNGEEVGEFYQKPFHSCIPIIKNLQIKANFVAQAGKNSENIFDFCARLLWEWENKRLEAVYDNGICNSFS